MAQKLYATGSWPSKMAVIDVNGDSKPDIVVANYGNNNIGVLLNTGGGAFTSQATYVAGPDV